MPRLPLLLKIAAAAAAGALALIVAARLRREDAVASLRREIREALGALVADDEDGGYGSDGEGAKEDASPPPPSVLITGFRAHGKSSLVNTACRALAAEDGPLLLRAEASPPGGGTDGPRRRRRVKAAVAGADGDGAGAGEGDVVELLDAPPLPEAVRLTREDIDAAISGGDPECVVFVLRCDAPTKERNAAIKRLPEISAAVRNKGQSASRTSCGLWVSHYLFILGRLLERPNPSNTIDVGTLDLAFHPLGCFSFCDRVKLFFNFDQVYRKIPKYL